MTIDYDPKTRAFAAQTRQLCWAVEVDRLEAGGSEAVEALTGAIVETVANVEVRRSAVQRAVNPLRADCARTARLAVQVAETGHPRRGAFARRRNA